MTTYTIPHHALASITNRINTLNTRATRHGHAPFILTIVREIQKPTPKEGVFTVWVEVALEGDAAWAEGWRLAARLEHVGGENLIHAAPLGIELPAWVRDGNAVCEHCGMVRQRLDTFVIERNGEFKRIGRNCLSSFCGTSPAAMLAQMEGWEELVRELAEGAGESDDWIEEPRHAGRLRFYTQRVMELACASVRVRGWCSIAQSKESERRQRATRDLVLDALVYRPLAYAHDEDHISVTPADTERAQAVISWATALGGDTPEALSDYEHNLRVLCGLPAVSYESLGFAVSAVAAYARAMTKATAREAAKASQHFGTLGKRETFVLHCSDAQAIPGQFGTVMRYRLEDTNGNRAIWWCSGAYGLDTGKTYKLTATVKEHGQWEGINQTTLARVKVVEELGQA